MSTCEHYLPTSSSSEIDTAQKVKLFEVWSPVKMVKEIININNPIREEKTIYQISVDDLDVSLLPMNRMSRTYLKTLNQLDDDLCTFLLYAEQKSNKQHGDIYEGESSQTSSVAETFTCHLCNLSILKVHMKTHNSSDKHKTMLALAKHGLERINKYLSQVDNDTEKDTSSTNYCPTCNIQIEPKDITNHNNSELHMMSFKKDRLISNLLKLYMDTVPTIHSENMNVQKLNHIKNESQKQIANKQSNYHVCEVCQVKVANNAQNILLHYSGKQHTQKAAIKNDQGSAQEMPKQKCVNNIQEKDTKLFRAVENNKNVTKKLWCDICKIKLTSTVCLQNHIYGKQHKLVMETIKESERKTNGNVKPPKNNVKPNPDQINNDRTSATSHHCATCNVNVPNTTQNISDHYNGKLHLKAMKKK